MEVRRGEVGGGRPRLDFSKMERPEVRFLKTFFFASFFICNFSRVLMLGQVGS